MRWGIALALGLMLAAPTVADAARQDQDARQQQSRQASPARPAAQAPRQAVQTPTRAVQNRAVTPARAGELRPARQADALRATSASRQAIPYRGAASVPQMRDRHGRLVAQPGFNRAVVNGQQARMTQQCSTVSGRRVCAITRQVAFRWAGGIAPAGGHQSQCPDGTMAMLALGHENVYRCVPF